MTGHRFRRPFLFLAMCTALFIVAAGHAPAFTISYTYDALGQVVQVDYGAGRSISYTYDEAGNILTKEVKGTKGHFLTVSRAGTGKGQVTSAPLGIECGNKCSAKFAVNTEVVLTATPEPGSTFAGWSGGGCSGTSPCGLTMDGDKALSATFAALPPCTYAIDPAEAAFPASGGQGSVTVSTGAHCSWTVTEGLDWVTIVSGAGGMGPGTVSYVVTPYGDSTARSGTINIAGKSFTISQDPQPPAYNLSVARLGGGTGTITSSPQGINCGSICSASFPGGTLVTLAATAGDGSSFTGWAGACSGTAACGITMSAPATVTASFTKGSTTASLYAWGFNDHGQLGDGTTNDRLKPVKIEQPADLVSVAAGGSHSLALAADGSVWAWGDNSLGQLGDGTTTERRMPIRLTVPSSVTAIAAGGSHSLALAADGSVWAWGDNENGQLGIGTNVDSTVPVKIDGLADVTAVSAGLAHSLALAADGSVWAWGRNSFGQLGDGTNEDRVHPVEVVSLPDAEAISAGDYHSVALASGGTVYAWGSNAFNQLGDGTTNSRNIPGALSNLTGVSAIVVGGYHSFAQTEDGVWGWGENSFGQLGDGTKTPRSRPVRTHFPVAALEMKGGWLHSIALDSFAWSSGLNEHGQLGDGTRADRAMPGMVSTIADVQAIAAGKGHSLAIASGAAGKTRTLTVLKQGTGTIASSPSGIDCGSTCIAAFTEGSSVTLSPAPGPGFVFAYWTGGCAGKTPACSVTMNADVTVQAVFVSSKTKQNRLAITKVRTAQGDGTVTSGDGTINCGTDCSEGFYPNSPVLLSASPKAGSTFTGWSPPCSGTGTCAITMDKAYTVKATFSGPAILTVTKVSRVKGTGTVTSTPAGIACSPTCKAGFIANTVVTLHAAPDPLSVFTSWSGTGILCPGTEGCTVTMDKAKTVKATFTGPSTLKVTITSKNKGMGTVTSTPYGISCPEDCSEAYPYQGMVTLTATAEPGSTFVSFSGCAAAAGTSCTVTMDKAKTVKATFEKPKVIGRLDTVEVCGESGAGD